MAAQGAQIARLSAEDITGTLAEDPSTAEYLRALADEYEALLRHCRPVDIESARRRHGE